MALFEIRNLTFTYPEAKTPALQEVNVAIEQGEFIVICGKSGCGKTTLLRPVSYTHLTLPTIA